APRKFRSSSRVKFPVGGFQRSAVKMRVDLSRGQAGVAEQLLHGAQVGAAGKHMRGEGVAQKMRVKRNGDSGLAAVGAQLAPELHARKPASSATEKDSAVAAVREFRLAQGQV